MQRGERERGRKGERGRNAKTERHRHMEGDRLQRNILHVYKHLYLPVS
jgi:hypothetical protein